MQIQVVSEIINHFVGLMHLDRDPLRTWSNPDGAAPDPRLGPEDATHLPGERHLHAVPDVPSDSSPFRYTVHRDDPMPRLPHVAAHPLGHQHVPPLHLPSAPPPDVPNVAAGGGGGDDSAPASAEWNGADQTVVDVHQVNMLIADVSYVDHVAGPLPMPDGTPVVHDMIGQAYAAIPVDAPGLGQSDSQELPILKTFEDSLASGTVASQHSLAAGTWVDGVMTSTDGTPDALTSPATTLSMTTPNADNVPFGQTIVTGQDVAGNLALVYDTSATHLTTIVMGNAVQADLIVQSNVVQNLDAIAVGSPTAFAQAISVGGDTVHDTAQFAQLPYVLSGTASAGLGQTWNVQVVNGDYYDVNAVTQQNVLVNDTLYAGMPSTDHYYAVLGGNTQLNEFSFTHDAPSYDLLIVLGNSYTANAVYQENVILNDATVGATFSATNGGADQVVTGHDAATNAASITSYGATQWAAATPDIQALVQSLLANGEAAAAFPGLPSLGSTVNVMIITGDYYSLNLVSQTNVISNSSKVLADLSGAGAGTPATVVAGQDVAMNSAAIVTAGASGTQYVGGQAYETAMLVQSNILTAHADTSVASPNALVPELVAFLDTGTSHDVTQHAQAPPTTVDASHHLVLA